MAEFVLSEAEFNVLSDRDFMPIKQEVCRKLEGLLAELRGRLKGTLLENEGVWPESWLNGVGKISKGENYQSYAWRVLDFPATFDQQDWFTFRTVVLWGHPIGFHLILSGIWKDRLGQHLLHHRGALELDWYLSDQTSPWLWEYPHPDLIPLMEASQDQCQDMLARHAFLKLSHFQPLKRYAQLPKDGNRAWMDLEQILKAGLAL
ncbi:hypothetical protein [Pontibacter sp. G13]|uniref:hypothetical protein n=1 Tax=Pontibacter sp. G13 TaxID=3074898 RepID=UPI00288AC5A4|nr:hypothetical protein [Pontibacter sp. G13]WNJ17482.1 hypothetical protein RJD25_21755 [Pontibacter sp. G13]